ncbi:hypothetical protein [Paenarthrobacter nitroguajacolicus]|uniref:hypothetical protein n=1 Tax=Paenarthrobacter nitroguajacolicus TaxID=211146 RepID=UPI001AE4F0A7|nr:hypothetical protein [Paenarthrobacter nitroguajacolicus]MDR6639557.1 hypothetical protein [Paenarthrobacter nitroguajacolicus]
MTYILVRAARSPLDTADRFRARQTLGDHRMVCREATDPSIGCCRDRRFLFGPVNALPGA